MVRHRTRKRVWARSRSSYDRTRLPCAAPPRAAARRRGGHCPAHTVKSRSRLRSWKAHCLSREYRLQINLDLLERS